MSGLIVTRSVKHVAVAGQTARFHLDWFGLCGRKMNTDTSRLLFVDRVPQLVEDLREGKVEYADWIGDHLDVVQRAGRLPWCAQCRVTWTKLHSLDHRVNDAVAAVAGLALDVAVQAGIEQPVAGGLVEEVQP